MTADLKIIVGAVFGVILTVLFPTIPQAYVLQGPHVIQLMTEKLGQARSLSVSQRVIFYNIETQPRVFAENETNGELKNPPDGQYHRQVTTSGDEAEETRPDFLGGNDSLDEVNDSANLTHDPPAGADQTVSSPVLHKTIQLDESLKYLFSDAFRSDIVSESNQRIYICNQGQTITVIDGVISDAAESQFDVYKDLLLYRSREILAERLSHLGIDISVSSLGRIDGRIAFVVGAEFPDKTVPQLWIDKETFHPLGIIVFGAKSPLGAQKGLLEIRYSKWQQIGKINYPMQIEFIQDGVSVRTIEVDDYQINPSFSKDVFDIARLKLQYRQSTQTPDPARESEGLSEVQKTIEEFQKIFE
ncbi:MAG: hypothetical protein P8185_14745 [Deltaproteobacteria bacterium]|jgi:hypothetical protein